MNPPTPETFFAAKLILAAILVCVGLLLIPNRKWPRGWR